MVSRLPSYGGKAVFLTVLIEGSSPSTRVTAGQVETWVESIGVPYSIGRDPDDAPPFLSRETFGPKETAYIVDRATRKIVAKGSNELALLPKLDELP
ncbi:MAG: hypothetical protein HYV09_39300 [Deltaproteobacteria bacterium]|nr:hypothetical protein [Deltaproteobacteria bacterium]